MVGETRSEARLKLIEEEAHPLAQTEIVKIAVPGARDPNRLFGFTGRGEQLPTELLGDDPVLVTVYEQQGRGYPNDLGEAVVSVPHQPFCR